MHQVGQAEAVYDGKIRIAIATDQTSFKQITSDVCHEFTHVIVGVLTELTTVPALVQ